MNGDRDALALYSRLLDANHESSGLHGL